MRKLTKRLISIFLTVAMVCSFIMVPSVAAEESDEVILSLQNGEWGNDGAYSVEVVATTTSGESFLTYACQMSFAFDNSILKYDGVDEGEIAPVIEGRQTYRMTFASTPVDVANKNSYIKFVYTDNNAKNHTVESGQVLATLYFVKASDDLESCDTNIELINQGNQISKIIYWGGDSEGVHTLVLGEPVTVSVDGVPPTLNSVALEENNVTVDGETDQTLSVTATSAKGTDITGLVQWSVSPENSGVSVNGGKVLVQKDAVAGDYTITAEAGEGVLCDDPLSATLTVTREKSVVKTVTVDKQTVSVPTKADSPTQTTMQAVAVDQYGDELDGTSFAWGVSEASGVSIDAETGVVTVTNQAQAGEVEVTAAAGANVTGTATLTITKADSVAESITLTGGQDTISVPTAKEGQATTKAFTAVVTDQFGDEMKNAPVTWSVSEADGVSIEDGVVTVTSKAQTGKVTVTATTDNGKTVSALLQIERADPVLTRMELLRDKAQVGENETLVIPGTGSAQYAYSPQGYDQFEEPYAVSAQWTLSQADEYVTQSNGTVTVASSAVGDKTYTLTAQADGISASTQITVKAIEVTWPTATTKAQPTYGDTWADIVTLSGGSAQINGSAVAGTFSLTSVGIPGAGSQTYVVQFVSKDEQYTLTKTYDAVQIAPLPVALTWDYNQEITYNGSEHTVSATVSNLVTGDTVALTYDGQTQTNAGKYTASVIAIDNANYTLTGGTNTSLAWTIAPKTVTVSDGDLVVSREYDGTVTAPASTGALSLAGVVDGDTVTVSGTIGNYSDKNAGEGKAISITDLTLAGASAGNYQLSETTYQFQKGSIIAQTVRVSGITANGKVYDGTTAAELSYDQMEISGKVGGDDLSVTAVGAFQDKSAGDNKAVDISNITLTGTDRGNYVLASEGNQNAATAPIAAKELELTDGTVVVTKVYDGTTDAGTLTGQLGLSGVIGEDAVEVAETAVASAYPKADYGTYPVTLSGIELMGNDAGNYTVAKTYSFAKATITKKIPTAELLTYTLDGSTYDGTKKPVAVTSTENGLGKITVLYQTGSEAASKDAPVNAGTYTVIASIAEGNNYEAKDLTLGTYSIAAKPLELTDGTVTVTKTYDGTPDAGTLTGQLALNGVVGGDDVAAANAAVGVYPEANSGTYTVTLSGISLTGDDAANYTVADTYDFTNATITKKTPTKEMLSYTLDGSTYDGTEKPVAVTSEESGLGAITVLYQTNSEVASTAAPVNAGTYQVTVSIAEERNYEAAKIELGTYSIAAKTLELTDGTVAVTKVYDGTVNAGTLTGQLELKGMVGEDEVQLADTVAAGAYPEANSGTYSVTLSGIALTGKDVANYTVADTYAFANATITKNTPTKEMLRYALSDGVYNGTEQPVTVTATESGFGAVTVLYQDQESGAAASETAPINVGTYQVVVRVAEGTNFTAAEMELGTYSITAKVLTLIDDGVTVTKVFDGTTDAGTLTGQLTLDGVVDGDTVALADTVIVGAYPNANYGTYSVTLSGIALVGDDAANYTVADTYSFAKATITKKLPTADLLTYTLTNSTYDGTEKPVAVTSAENGLGAITVLYQAGSEAASTDVPVNAGTYTVIASVAEGSNYAHGEFNLGTYTIAKADRVLTVTPAALTLTPNALTGTIQATASPDADKSANVTYALSGDTAAVTYQSETGSITAVGNGTVTVVVSVAETDNYNAAADQTVTVKALAQPVTGIASVTAGTNDQLSATLEDGKIVVSGFRTVGTALNLVPELADESLTAELNNQALVVKLDGQTICTYEVDTTNVVEKDSDVEIGNLPPEIENEITDEGRKTQADEALKDPRTKLEQLLESSIKQLYNLLNDLRSSKKDEIEAVTKDYTVEIKVGVTITAKDLTDRSFRMDVQPTYQIQAVDKLDQSKTVAMDKGSLPNEYLTTPVTVNVKLPTGFPTEHLFAKHTLSEGGMEILPVTVSDGVAQWQQRSFSEVELYSDARTGSIQYTFADGSMQTISYNAINVGEDLPTDTKSGNTFNGWEINGTVYTAMTEELLDVLSNATDPVAATASFTPNASPKRNNGVSSAAVTYAVTAPSAANGTVTLYAKNAAAGSTVTVTAKPEEGYVLDKLTVTDANGNELTLTSQGDGTYTFVMPDARVSVEALFSEEVSPDIGVYFTDVDEAGYYYEAMRWAVTNGVTSGTSDTTFSPDASCTRAQMVMFLWRASGSPAPASQNNPFADVSSDSYYYSAVLWAVEQGITSGTSDTTFSPDATVTRAQTVTFLYNAAGKPEVSGTSFDDVDSGSYYANAVAWAVEQGITSGTGTNTFSPDNDCTRAQIVTFLYKNNVK
jgi:hypothetical protein